MIRSAVDLLSAVVREHALPLTGALTVVVYGALIVAGDGNEVAGALAGVDPRQLLVAVSIVTVSYLVRLLRWMYYLRHVEEFTSLGVSIVVFFSGLVMAVTPGKIGEVWKASLLQRLEGVPASKTVSIVSAERVTDLLAVAALTSLGIASGTAELVPVVVVVVVLLGVLLSHWRRLWGRLYAHLQQYAVLKGRLDGARTFYENVILVFQPTTLVVGVAFGCCAWALEGVAFWVIVQSFGLEFGIVRALFVFAFGTLVGAISLLPGGVGAAEAGLVGLLVAAGTPLAVATSVTLLIRASTLWYGVSLGGIVFGSYQLYRHQFTTASER